MAGWAETGPCRGYPGGGQGAVGSRAAILGAERVTVGSPHL